MFEQSTFSFRLVIPTLDVAITNFHSIQCPHPKTEELMVSTFTSGECFHVAGPTRWTNLEFTCDRDALVQLASAWYKKVDYFDVELSTWSAGVLVKQQQLYHCWLSRFSNLYPGLSDVTISVGSDTPLVPKLFDNSSVVYLSEE